LILKYIDSSTIQLFSNILQGVGRIFVDGTSAVINVQKGCNTFASNTSNPYWYMIELGGIVGNNFRYFPTQNVFFNGCLGPIAYMRLKPNDRDSLMVDYFYSESRAKVEPKI
jgi:hypothetical protein